MKKPLLTQKELKSILLYEPETGIFRWKIKTASKVMVGTEAGTTNPDGYVMIGIQGHIYCAHRLAFLYMTGSEPVMVDHKDRNTGNNRWNNLRATDYNTNGYNAIHRKRKNNFPKGVQKVANIYSAIISMKGKRIYLGSFNTPEEAGEAYRKAALNYHGEFARTHS